LEQRIEELESKLQEAFWKVQRLEKPTFEKTTLRRKRKARKAGFGSCCLPGKSRSNEKKAIDEFNVTRTWESEDTSVENLGLRYVMEDLKIEFEDLKIEVAVLEEEQSKAL
jgi:hypothetical protein